MTETTTMMPQREAVERRQLLWSLLGDLPRREIPIAAQAVFRQEHETYAVEWLQLDLNGIEPVRACFVSPLDLSGPAPVFLYHHAHGGTYDMGCSELLEGRSQFTNPPYAEMFAGHGCCALAIDCWNFGARHRRSESSLYKEMLWKGQVLWGMMVYDASRAVDFLVSRPEVDASRIGTLGFSMGSTMAWWLAALDERISLCIDLCCLTDYQTLIETDGLDLHGLYYYVPGLLKHFTASEINGLIAPRRHLSLAGLQDPLTPESGLRRIDDNLKHTYTMAGAPECWQLSVFDSGHRETPEMRRLISEWIERWAHGR